MNIDKIEKFGVAYYPDFGVFKDSDGGIMGRTTENGYISVRFCNEQHLAHRLAMYFISGEWPAMQVDHVNGVKIDNRAVNLRDVSQSANLHNPATATHQRGNEYPRGVSLYKKNGKFRGRIMVNGVIYQRYFATPLEASDYVKGIRDAASGLLKSPESRLLKCGNHRLLNTR